MNTINHALWGATIGRTVGHPLEGALIASIPDLISIPPLAYFSITKKIKPQYSPKWALRVYQYSHNWLIGGLILVILLLTNKYLFILGLGYFWHLIEDAFVHTEMATQFLYPVWEKKIQIISASENKWIQVVDITLIIIVNIIITVVML